MPLSSFDEIEEAHDQREELLALVVDGLHELGLLGGELAGEPLGQHLAVADDRRQRRAELVADGGEKVRLQPIELLELVVGLLKAGGSSLRARDSSRARSGGASCSSRTPCAR